MAKLSFYKTIDRSQLGGKFVPLIKSGVSNYKILASDLGKEYHPGDAIEITDTGEINVKFNSDDFDVSSGSLTIKTDESRGVFKGTDGIYIASADSTIDVSSSGIEVNTDFLAGDGLRNNNGSIYVKSADNTINVTGSGVRVYYDSGLKQDNHGRLIVDDTYVIHTIINSDIAGNGLYWTHPGYADSSLYVKSADNTINVSSEGIKVNIGALVGDHLSFDTISNHIAVDTASVARAITGSGLVTTNGTIGVNVNTATGIIVQNNKLYLNAGAGLQTSNNTLSVKAADGTINVGSGGVKVKIKSVYSGLGANYEGLYVQSADNSIAVLVHDGIKVNTGYGLSATFDGLYVKSADNSIDVYADGIKVNPSAITGSGLVTTNGVIDVNVNTATGIIVKDDKLYLYAGAGLHTTNNSVRVKSADSSIGVANEGIKVNPSALAGEGLTTKDGKLTVNLGSEGGIAFGPGGGALWIKPDAIAGYGLLGYRGTLYVKSADSSIGVSGDGIKVNPSALVGQGLTVHSDGHLRVKIGPGLTTHGAGELAVNTSYLTDGGNLRVASSGYLYASATHLAGYGLKADGYSDRKLEVLAADGSIDVTSDGIKVNKSALSIPTADSLAGNGLHSVNGSALYVKSADNTIGVSSHGIKVNSGYGLETNEYGLSAKAANVTVNVSPDGISVPIRSGGGILAGSDGLYLDSGSISGWLAGDGLENKYNILYVKSADNTIGVSSDGIRVNAGYGLSAVHNGLYVKSAGGTIGVTSSGIGVNVQSGGGILTGINGLYIDSAQLAGSGLGYKGDANKVKLYVIPADNTITVGSDGIKVNTDNNTLKLRDTGLYVDTAYVSGAIAGSGLVTGADGKLNVKTADNSISVHNTNGIGVNIAPCKYLYKSADGLSFDSDTLFNYLGSGAGLKIVDSALYVQHADDSIAVSEHGIKVNVQSGGGILLEHDGLRVDSSVLPLPSATSLAGTGLGVDAGKLYIKSANNSIGVSEAGIKVNTGNVAAAIFSHGLEYNSGKLNVYCGSGLVLEPTSGKVSVYYGSGLNTDDFGRLYVTSSATTPDLGKGLWLASDNDSLLSVYAGSGLAFDDQNRLSVHAGSGLEIDNSGALYVNATSLAGTGLESDAGKLLYVKSADGTIGVSSSGIKVNAGYGLNAISDGLYVQAADNSIVVSGHGIGVHTSAIAGHGLMSNTEGKLDINYGSGLGIDGSGRLYVTHSSESGGSILGVAVSTPNNGDAWASDGGIAIGESAATGGENSVAIGRLVHLTSGSYEAVAIGYVASAIGYGSVSLGARATSYDDFSIAIGMGATTVGGIYGGQYSISAGYNASASAVESVVIGAQASSSKTKTVVIGADSTATGSHSIVIGAKASAGTSSIAIGYGASAGDGFICLRTYDSEGRGRDVKFDSSGYMYAANDNQSISRRFDQFAILTPPEPNSIVSINAGVQYIADKPIWVCGRVYSTTTTATAGWLYINSSVVLGCSSNNSIMDSFALPIAPGDSYEFYTGSKGSQAPILFTMDCQ